ncbi:MAG: tetratricopeptide repeat protein [Syntrophothermus sp.]
MVIPLVFLFMVVLWLSGVLFLVPDPGFAARPVESPWKQVAAEMEELVAADPDNIEYIFRLAVAYANLGRIDESANAFIRAGEIDKERVYAEKIIAAYRPELDSGRLNLLELNYLAFAYYSEDQYAEACQVFYKVVEADPANEWPRNYLGFSLYKANRLDEAIPVLQKAVRLNPSNEYSHFLLGMAYYYKGWYFRAIGEAARAPNVIKKFFK